MFDRTTIVQIIVIVAYIAILLYLGIKEKKNNEENLKKIPLRINVNGIRGKSTATRLITGVLTNADYKVVGKTTGTSPRMIYWNKKDEEVIKRNLLGANIKEQIKVINKAQEVGAEALVCECMAVRPEYQAVYQNDIFKSNITVIVNVLEDHLDVMGPTTDEIALAFSETIPYNGHLVVDNGPYVKYFEEVCKERNTKLVVADNSKIPEGLIKKFKYTIFEDNISLALAVAEILGIDNETAFEGMLNANPDPGAATINPIEHGNSVSNFVNGFAANEPESTLAIWDKIKDTIPNTENPIVLFNGREDRIDRTNQFVNDCFPYLENTTLIGIGEGIECIQDAIDNGSLSNIKEYIDLSDYEVDEVIDELYNMMDNRVIYGIGNIHGQAEILLQKLCNIYIHTDEYEEHHDISIRSYIKSLRSSNF